MVIGIDPGKNTGIVAIVPDGARWKVTACNSISSMGRLTDDNKHIHPGRLQELTRKVLTYVNETTQKHDGPVIFSIEEPFVGRNAATALAQHAVFSMIVFALRAYYERFILVLPQTLKKFVGFQGKELFALEVERRWGFKSTSQDVIDAYALARYVAEKETVK